jgi:hydrogenase expression/formation protein HypE
MRDSRRDRVATSLNELAHDCGQEGVLSLAVLLSGDAIPVRDEAHGACELLGLDSLHIANEGQFLAVIVSKQAEAALDALRSMPVGAQASIIGEMSDQPAGSVLVKTLYGGSRIVDMLVGDPPPRIC